MNLNISYNWLKEYVKTDLTPQEFAKRISLVGPSVDHITEVKPNFSKVVVGQIKSIANHPNADKLHVCQVDVGKKELQIVCGAPNIKAGQKVPVVLVGGKVGEFEITAAKLRGVESFGMMCSQKELGLGDDHAGIFILPDDSQIGEPLEKAMPINDYILDVEVTSNRPDAMSIIGLAREAAASLGEKFTYKEAQAPKINIKQAMPLSVKVQEKKLCPRYEAVVMNNIKVSASPLWLQQRLLSAGLRPINNLVDITNYILLEFGQPMHVFDYDKLVGQEINVRLAKKGEKILALDGKEYELADGQLVIADKKTPVAVAGIMGGELSAATAETTTIVFECANFEAVAIRRTSRALNLRSDSSNLYEKGISPENTSSALVRAIGLAQEIAGGAIASQIIDEKNESHKAKKINLSLTRLNQVLGITVAPIEVKKSLTSLGFVIKMKTKDILEATVPWWRDNDMSGDHDLIEEIARLHGYANLPTAIMATQLPVNFEPADDEFYWEDKIKDFLAGFGLTEIYTYSFISEKALANAGLKAKDHIRIANPLSADFEYMRVSLVPGALQIIAENQGLCAEGKLFDLSKVYLPKGDHDLADENLSLLIAVFKNDGAEALTDAKGILEGLRQRLNIDDFEYKESSSTGKIYQAEAGINSNGKKIGFIGLLSGESASACGLKKAVAVIELDFPALIAKAKTAPEYAPIPKFPAIELDLSMEISESVSFAQVATCAQKTNKILIEKVDFLSVYQGDKLAVGKKALAVRITYRHKDKTLELAEAQEAHKKVAVELEQEYNIVVR